MLLAGVLLGKLHFRFRVTAHHADGHAPVRKGQGTFHALAEARTEVLLHNQAVHHDVHRVLLVLVKRNGFLKIVKTAVNADPYVAAPLCVGQHLFVGALLLPDNGGKHHEARADGQLHNFVNDAVKGLLGNFLAADGTVRSTDARVQQAQVIVNLRHGAYRGARVFGGGFLLNGNGGGKPLNAIHVGLVQLPQKLTRIGGQRLHEAAVPLGVDGFKGEGGFARPRKPREDHQLVARNLHVDIF